MRYNGLLTSLVIALASGLGLPAPATAQVFGSVTAIGGSASDIALDESRGYLYIANFGAGVIDVMSISNGTIQTSINVAPQPGALAISQDAQYLLIAHYANGSTSPQGSNLITLIHLADNSVQTFNTGDPPLGVAFLGTKRGDLALIVTTTSILSFNPISGQTAVIDTFANLATTLPVAQATFPGQILQTELATSGDGNTVWGIAGAGTANQVIYRFDGVAGSIYATGYVSSPALLPRVSVSNDGTYAMVGYSLIGINSLNPFGFLQGRYPNVLASTTITGSAIDQTNGIIYGQFPDANQPTGPATTSSTSAATTSSVKLPALLIMDADNLTIHYRINMPENIVGRAILNSAATVLYAISESGVMTLPVGNLNKYPRVTAAQEDVLVTTNFCNQSNVTQSLTITDPGGGNTPFTITPGQSGVSISPASGTTPATVQVTVNPNAFPGSSGTTAVSLQLSSNSAVNQPQPVRLLLNNPNPSQRGTVIDQPGVLSDILPDPARNRFYVLRQDMNQLLVFDGTSNGLIATLRTATTPTMMSFTSDQNFLLVGHNDSQLVKVFDLNALVEASSSPIVLPGGHYARSIAQSNASTLILARNEQTGNGIIDTVNVAAQTAAALNTLGIYKNQVLPTGVLTPSPNGSSILLASPDGNVMLYSAAANTFIASRQDMSSLSGAFAASSYNTYVVGNTTFDASLVPSGTLGTSGTASSGFAFTGPGGYMTSATTSGAGIIQQVAALQSGGVSPVTMAEAPLTPTAATTSSTSSGGAGTGAGTGTGTTTSTNGSGSTSIYAQTYFTRTVAPLPSAGTVVVLSTSGFTVLAANYAAAVAPPSISSIVNAADGTSPVAPGGLITVYGQQMSPVNMATSQVPLPTALADSCLSINGSSVPLLFVSNQQINAQLPYNVSGSSALTIYTPGGISNNYYFTVQPTAPSIFMSASAGPETGLAAIVRTANNQLVTPTNPINPKDTIVIFLTGMGLTTPQVKAGLPAPQSPLAAANVVPIVTLGGAPLSVSYAGLSPNEVGVYQINATVPTGVTQGLSIPLTISQGGASTTISVRVVN
jgi:uncharacterized protein (TIGR03437 family)